MPAALAMNETASSKRRLEERQVDRPCGERRRLRLRGRSGRRGQDQDTSNQKMSHVRLRLNRFGNR